MNILITGIKGMLGSAVKDYFLAKNCNIYGIYRSGDDIENVNSICLDLTDLEALKKIEHLKDVIDVVIHCAANVNVNACESDRQSADNIHIHSTAHLAKLFPSTKFIYISTDSVYDGVNGKFNEEDIPNPKNYYAASKLAGEQKVLENNSKPYILRTNIYGVKKPMAGSLFEWAYTNLVNNKPITGYSNVYFNPLFVNQLAEIIYLLLENNVPPGIYNVAGSSSISKYDFIELIKKSFNLTTDISATELPGMINGVERPLNTTLDTSKISNFIKMSNFSVLNGIESIRTQLEE
jgi:dTDP-4-dehydrorhamnose reductase